MNKILETLKKAAAALLAKPVVNRTLHTAWQSAFGALVAALSTTHGDVKVAVLVAGAAFASSVKNAILKPAN